MYEVANAFRMPIIAEMNVTLAITVSRPNLMKMGENWLVKIGWKEKKMG